MGKTTVLLGIYGSLRRKAFSKAVVSSLQDLTPTDVRLDLASLAELPFYNQDLDPSYGEVVDWPPTVATFRDSVAAAAGLVICTPEYNYGIPGVLKNALDWASRPAHRSPLAGKLVLIISCSPAFTGGVRAQAPLRQVLTSCLANVLTRAEVVIGAVQEKVVDNRLVDPTTRDFCAQALADLVSEIRAREVAGAANS